MSTSSERAYFKPKNPIRDNIAYLEREGYIVLTKLELNEIIRNTKLGKIPVLRPNGSISGWRE